MRTLGTTGVAVGDVCSSDVILYLTVYIDREIFTLLSFSFIPLK